MEPRTRLVVLFTAFVAVVLVVGLGVFNSQPVSPLTGLFAAGQPAPSSAVAPRLVFARTLAVMSEVAFVADSEGFWKNAGLDVQTAPTTSGKAGLDLVLAGKADVATVAEVPIAIAALKGEPVVILTEIAKAEPYAVVARRSAGIQSPQDLEGKTVGVKPKGGSEYFFDSFVRQYGLNASRITVKAVEPEYAPLALAHRDVDAVFFWEPYATIASRALGSDAVRLPGDYGERFLIVTTRDKFNRNRAAFESFIRGLTRADEFVAANPEAAKRVLQTNLNLNATETEALWPHFRFQNALDADSNASLLAHMRWAVAKNYSAPTGMPNVNALFDDSLFKSS